MDDRISQLVQMVDGQSASMWRLLLFVGMFVALLAILVAGYYIQSIWFHDRGTPQPRSIAPAGFRIGDAFEPGLL